MATRFVRIGKLAGELGVARSTLYSWINEGRLPKPIKLGRNVVGWWRDSLEAKLREERAE